MPSAEKSLRPNAAQQKAIAHPPAPLMILAGAGTGKTFTLENRIVYHIEHYQVDPRHILAITYTEKAARELQSRIIKRVGQAAQRMTVCTFHSFCYRLIKEYGPDSAPQLLDESEAIHMLLERFDELRPFASDEFPLDPQKAVTHSFIPFFNRARDELINPEVMEIPPSTEEGPITAEIANQLKDLQRIYPLFQQWKAEYNLVDYGDMILSAYHLLEFEKDIRKQAQDQYRHIIVDEFQDNNFALNEVMGLIAGDRKFITVVGDDDQVIYSFRGANSYNIQAFKDRYGSHPGFEPITLDENFRSTQPILDLANRAIEHNLDRTEKTLQSRIKPEGPHPIRFWGEKQAQVEFMIREIQQLSADGISYGDMAILCRTHSQGRGVVNALRQAGIPVQAPRQGFFSVSLVRDLIAWCQVIGGGSYQDTALFRIIEQNCGYKAAHKIFSAFNTRDTTPRFDLIFGNQHIHDQYPQVKNIMDSVNEFRNITQKKSAGEMVWEICKNMDILKSRAQRYALDDHFELLNIGDLLKRAQNFTRRNKKNDSLTAFNIYLEAVLKSGGLPSLTPPAYRDPAGVTLNTVHGVKGAEFPVVFLPFQRSASFPLNFTADKRVSRPPDEWLRYTQATDLTPKEHHYQEERRLFYVAVTRAQDRLYILAPKKATSKFIKELPETLMEDQPMTDPGTPIKSYSALKIKYEQYLQKALSREEYVQVKQFSDALAFIKQHEKGEHISLGNSDWEQELQSDLSQEYKSEIPEQINLSASAIETYETCPLKFRLGRLDGIPQTASKPELVFGNIIHRVLQRFHAPGKELSQERILHLLDEEWKEGEFDYAVREEKFKEQGQEMLARYTQCISQDPPKVIKREEKFSFEMDSIAIRGAIDRIDQTESGTHIVDYKTSKTFSTAKSNLQLAIYSMYLEQLEDPDIGGRPASAALYFLRDEEKPIRSHSFTSDQIRETKEKIIDVAAGIRNREFNPTKGRHCDWCDYKDLVCPAWEE